MITIEEYVKEWRDARKAIFDALFYGKPIADLIPRLGNAEHKLMDFAKTIK